MKGKLFKSINIAYALLKNQSLHRHHGSAKAILLKRGVLPFALRETKAEVIEDSMTENALALAMDKHNLLALGITVGVHHFAECIELDIEHSSIIETCGRIYQFIDVQIYLNDITTETARYGVNERSLLGMRLTALIALGTNVLLCRELCTEQGKFELFVLCLQRLDAFLEILDFLLLLFGLGQETGSLLLSSAERSLMYGCMTGSTSIALVGYHYTLRDEGGYLKPILILYHNHVLVLECDNLSATLGIKETDLIAYLY